MNFCRLSWKRWAAQFARTAYALASQRLPVEHPDRKAFARLLGLGHEPELLVHALLDLARLRLRCDQLRAALP